MDADCTPLSGCHTVNPRSVVFDTLDFAVLLSDADGRVVDCNGVAEKMFGWSRDDLLGKRPEILFAPQNATKLEEEVAAVLRREGHWKGQLAFQRRNGAQVLSEYSVRSLNFPNGPGTMHLHCHREIEPPSGDAWEQSGERLLLRALIDAVPDLIFCKDIQGRFLLRNAASEREAEGAEATGMGQGIGLTVFELPQTQPHAERYHADDLEVIRHGRPVVNREEPFVRLNGSTGWYLTSKYPLRDAAGKIIGLVGVSRDITIRRETELKLADERRVLRTLIDAIPDLIFFKDRDGRHLAINEAAKKSFGVNEERALGCTVFEWPIPKELARGYDADDRSVIETGSPLLNREELCLDAAGRERHLLTSKYPLFDSEGGVYGLVGVARDVTESRKAAADLKRTQMQLSGHLENSPLAVVEWTEDFRVQLWTGQSVALFGWESSEVVGRHFADWPLVHPEDVAEFARGTGGLLLSEECSNAFEVRNLSKEGAVIHCVWQNSVLRDGHGKVVSILSMVRNVSERVQAEAKVREHEQLYYTLVEATHTGFVHFDESGRVVEVNEEFMRLTGRTSFAEVLGLGIESWVAPSDWEKARKEYEQGVRAGFIRNLELDFVSPDGTVVPVEFSARVRETPVGKRVLAFCRDISARRIRESEQQAFDRQLQETQKLESLGILAGSIAHDFNNLLTGIIGNANLARCESDENPELQVYLDQIEIAATRAADLCRQMLAYSGKGRFVVEELNLNSAVEETARLVQISISKKVDLQYALLPQLPLIRADATQVRQVLMNLLINAAEAVGDNRGTILVSTRVVSIGGANLPQGNLVGPLAPGRYVCLRVRDTGSGMSPETRKRIFEPFYTTKKTGRGLGLAAVLGIMRGHKGALSVESEPGKGTCFELHFPCVESDVSKATAGEGGEMPWKRCGTVLVVDDEDTVRVAVSLMLQSLGFVVLHVSNGAEAVAAVAERTEDFALVLLDLTMPQLHGDESLRGMRRFQPKLKAIVMSGYDESEVLECFADQSMEAFLQKPFRLPQLRQKIHQLLVQNSV
jgi:two-component system cell cycle sensor histidine kinase/response regulator CckA